MPPTPGPDASDIGAGAAIQTPKPHAGAATAQKTAPQDMSGDREAFQMVIGQHLIGAMTSNLIMLGDRLGLYAGLKDRGPCNAAELAKEMDMSERYIREWLLQQAAAKIIACDAEAEQFWLTPAQADVLVHEHGKDASPYFFVGGFEMMPSFCRIVDKDLPRCFKTGEGLAYDEYGDKAACGICRELGVWARHCLVDCLGRTPGLKEKLEKGAMVADVGCGCGVALVVAAKAFPNSTFHGYDISEAALKVARQDAKAAGLSNLTFHNAGVEEEKMPAEPTYDLVMTHDAIHDMARPDKVLRHVRAAMKPDGVWIIGDITSMDTPAATLHNHPLAALLWGFSCHICLPSGLSAPGGLGLGTTGLPVPAMKKILKDAGFSSVEVLDDWAHPLNTYYIAKP